MTFCATWRKRFVVFFFLIAVVEALRAVHLPLTQQALSARYLLCATFFAVAGLLLMLFDYVRSLDENGCDGGCGEFEETE